MSTAFVPIRPAAEQKVHSSKPFRKLQEAERQRK